MVPDRAANRPLRTAAWASLIGAVALTGALAVNGAVGSGARERGGQAVSEVSPDPAEQPARFRMASFNVLGAGHTDKGGNRKGWASGTQRMTWAVQFINNRGLDVIGFQEFQEPQFDKFKELQGKTWAVYPGARFTHAAMQNSIGWKTSVWQLVEARTVGIPYFDGNMIRMPYVLLRHVETGRLAWFFNTHNPADARGPAQRWRDKGFAIEANVVNGLEAEMPDVPVFSTGDKNDRGEYFCPTIRKTRLRAANGGGLAGNTCVLPQPSYVDWVMGTDEVSFTDYKAVRNKLVRKITDHPVITSGVTIPPVSVVNSPIDHVVLVNLEGLTSRALYRWAEEDGLRLADLMAGGASTLNARTAYERTINLPNVTGMLTGRRVDPTAGGHGVSWRSDPRTTVHAAAGDYVPGIFDVAHDFELRTALYTTDPGLARLNSSWDGLNGATDRHGDDNGRDKIDDYVYDEDERALVTRLAGQLQNSPARLTVVSFDLLSDVGVEHGFASSEYRKALRKADNKVRTILKAIDAGPMAGRTMLIVTSSHGGSKRAYTPASEFHHYRVPIIVSGPGVASGVDLYSLNPQYTRPGTERPTYADPQPIRLEDLANLVTRQLGLPRVPDTTANLGQTLVVTPPA